MTENKLKPCVTEQKYARFHYRHENPTIVEQHSTHEQQKDKKKSNTFSSQC